MNARHLRWPRFALILVAGFLHGGPVRGAALAQEEVAEAAARFDGLEWPDLAGKPYVEIMFGKQRRVTPRAEGKASVEEIVDGPKVRGFLLAEDVRTYTIFIDGFVTDDGRNAAWRWPLATEIIEKMSPEVDIEFQITARRIDLPIAVDEAIATARGPVEKGADGHALAFKLSPTVTLFGLARDCARVGRADLAARLEAELRTIDDPSALREDKVSLPSRVEKELAHVAMQRAFSHCGGFGAVLPGMHASTRSELLAEFTRVAREFPGSTEHAEAARLAEILHKMIAEDETHKSIGFDQLEKLSREEQAREWIFQLREENYFPGFMTDTPGPDPVRELVKLGLPAVPALLEILGDPRLTRTVPSSSQRSLPGPIFTYGDCAVDALSQIAGRQFGFDSGAIPPVRADRAEARRREIDAWWKGVRSRGEKATLIRYVRAGRDDAADKAGQLNQIAPAAAVEAIAAGLAAARNKEFQHSLLQVLVEIKSDAATAALRYEMIRNRDLQCRVSAAEELFARGAKGVTPVMVKEFQNWKPVPFRHYGYCTDDPRQLILFLGTCGDLASMKALAARMPKLPPDLRAEIAVAVVSAARPIPVEVERLGEAIALSALEDQAGAYGWWGVRDGPGRVCDLAAGALSKRWPKKYSFEMRDFHRVVDLGLPAYFTGVQVTALALTARYSFGTALPTHRFERDAAIMRIRNQERESRGLAALPVPPRPESAAAQQEPNVIAACLWHGGPRLAGLAMQEGRPLTAAALLASLEQMEQALPQDCRGFAVSAERSGDRRGFVVDIEWLRGPRARCEPSWSEEDIHYSLGICGADEAAPQGGGSRPLEGRSYALDGNSLREVDEALAASFDWPLAFYFGSERWGGKR